MLLSKENQAARPLDRKHVGFSAPILQVPAPSLQRKTFGSTLRCQRLGVCQDGDSFWLCNCERLKRRKSQGSKATIEQALVDVNALGSLITAGFRDVIGENRREGQSMVSGSLCDEKRRSLSAGDK
jgi:hypothetical protein